MRRVLIIGLAVLLTLLAAHTGFWRWAVLRAEAELQAWAEVERSRGWVVELGSVSHGGWPLGASVTVADLHVAAIVAGLPDRLDFRAAAMTAGVAFFNPRRVVAHLDGALQLQVGDGPVLPFTARNFTITVAVPPSGLPHAAELVTDDLRLGATETPLLRVAHGELNAAWQEAALAGQPALSLAVRTEAMQLPPEPLAGVPGELWALGNQIRRLDLAIAVNGPVIRVASPMLWATAWRNGGGTATVTLAGLDWGSLGASGAATLSLDAALQPAGTATLRVSGFAETLDALAAARIVPARTVSTAKAVLSLMARPQPNGPAVVEAPLTLQDRTLQFARFPLARMPIVQWSAPP